MKAIKITRSIIAALLLSSAGTVLMAQNASASCPLGNPPGYGRSLTPEQKAEQCAVVQQRLASLREKQAQGTLTSEELAWLQQTEQRGGRCITGTPRGPGAGRGEGNCNGMGQRKRQGLRDGTGPRSADGTCPVNPQRQQQGQQQRGRR